MLKKCLGIVIAVTMMFSLLAMPTVLGESQTIRVEGEWVQTKMAGVMSVVSDEKGFFSNDQFAIINADAGTMPEGGYILNYEVYAPKAGVYNMSYFSTLSNNSPYVSKYSIGVNGGEEFTPTEMVDNTVIRDIYAKYSTNIVLEAGSNQIAFHVRDSRTCDSRYVFYLDYFDLIYLSDITTPIRIEAEDYVNINCGWAIMNQAANTGLSGGVAYQYMNPASTPVMVTYNLYAPYEGDYTMSMLSSVLGEAFTSDYNIIINDTVYTVTTDNCIKLADITATHDPGLYKKYSYKDSVHLKKGNNTMQFVTSETRSSGDIYIVFLDYIQFDSIGNMAVEGESQVSGGFGTATVDGASGGALLNANLPVTSLPAVNTYNITVAKTGTYDLYFDFGAYVDERSGDQKYLAPIEISINGGDYQRLSIGTAANNFSDGNITNIKNIPLLQSDQFGRYKLNTTLNLSSGFTTIAFRISDKGPSNSSAFFYLDKFEFVPQSPLKSAEIKLDKTMIATSETVNASISTTNELGLAMDTQSMDSITFTSSDTNIATVDNTGIITAVNPGNAKITAEIKKDNVTVNAEKDILVYSQGTGVVTVGAKSDGSNTTVKLAKVGDTAGTVTFTLVAAAYSKENGTITSIKNVKVNEAMTVNPMLVSEITFAQEKATGDIVQVFVIDNLTNMQPLFSKYIVE